MVPSVWDSLWNKTLSPAYELQREQKRNFSVRTSVERPPRPDLDKSATYQVFPDQFQFLA